MAARQPIVYFYVIPFDNLKDDPTIEWISSGLSDMVSNKFKNEPGLLIQNKQDLEVIMNDRSLMLKQPIASRNLLLLGKYSRQLEKINISVQLIDLATWEQIESKNLGTIQNTSYIPRSHTLLKVITNFRILLEFIGLNAIVRLIRSMQLRRVIDRVNDSNIEVNISEEETAYLNNLFKDDWGEIKPMLEKNKIKNIGF